jgi:imidazole glycerol-phosphate synthase subunit HisH
VTADVVIIDSGGANLASLVYALERLGATARVSDQAQVIRAAPRVLLPGVGSAGNAMARLRSAGLDQLIPTLAQPVLGICLGMQLLFAASAEGDAGDTACLGIIPGRVARIPASPQRPVPHMGWNRLRVLKDDPLLAGIAPTDYFYFVHSFAAPVGPYCLAVSDYGGEFTALARRGNFAGAQFHPERSARPGARLLSNFLKT